MHPPAFNPSHLLSEWPGCRLEVKCQCGRMTMIPTLLLAERIGDQPIGPVAQRLKCDACGKRPAQVWLVAGNHRSCVGGPAVLDWAVEIKVGM